MIDYEKLEEIYTSFLNGQNKQAVEFIKTYGDQRFFRDYITYLDGRFDSTMTKYCAFQEAVLLYNDLKN